MSNRQPSAHAKSLFQRRLVTLAVCSALVAGTGCSGLSSLYSPAPPAALSNADDFQRSVYGGVSFGPTSLEPDTSETLFTVENSDATGNQLRIGVDISERLSVELDTSVLGEAELAQAGTSVEYSAASASLLYYAGGSPLARHYRQGLNPYLRLGYGMVDRSSQVIPLDGDDKQVSYGAGIEYGLNSGLAWRADYTQLSDEVTLFGLGVVYRFGKTPAEIGRSVVDTARPLWDAEARRAEPGDTPRDDIRISQRDAAARRAREAEASSRYARTTSPEAQSSLAMSRNYGAASTQQRASHQASAAPTSLLERLLPVRQRRAGSVMNDFDRDNVANADDLCPDTAADVAVDQEGCGLFDMILQDVTFKPGSTWLSPRARGQLDEIGELLRAFPEVRVGVIAHTDNKGAADFNLNLSLARAEAVSDYLLSQGVSELQLEPEGRGEAQPIDSNNDDIGRRRNRRVELQTRPSRNAENWRVARQGRVHREAEAAQAVTALRVADRPIYRPASTPGRTPLPQQKQLRDAAPSSEPGLGAALPTSVDSAEAAASQLRALPRPRYVPGFTQIGVIEGVNFAAASAELDATARNALTPLLQELKQHGDVKVAIMAHTDNQGAREQNYQLSMQRAESVRRFLVTNGIASDRVVAEGYGEIMPVAQNVTDADRARNRRIEVRIID